jgi:ABC-2 type transport system permease protein
MKKFIVLTIILLKNSLSTLGTGKSSKKKSILYLALIVMGVLPMVVGIGTSTATMYDILVQVHQEGILLATGFTTVSLLILVFGIFYVINIFYFAQDIDKLLPLPLRPSQLTSAKFCVSLVYEYLTVAMFLLPLIIAFGIKSNGGLLFYIYSFFLLLVVPVIPLVIAGTIVLVLMRFSNLTKKKDQFRIIAAVFGILLVLAINYFTSNYLSVTDHPERTFNLLNTEHNSFINLVARFFPLAKIASDCLLNYHNLSGFTNLLSFYLINSVFIVLFLTLSEAIYLKGAVGGSEIYSGSKSLTKDELYKSTRKSSVIKSYILKETKILLRTPAFFINCILTNFLWPIILTAAYLGVDTGLQKVTQFLVGNNTESIILACSVALSMFISASNSIAASALSREGNNFFVNKYLPVFYRDIIVSKLYTAFIVSFTGFLIVLIAAEFLLKLQLGIICLSIILSLEGIIFTSLVGFLFDINYPKLIWDNEYKPIKQNMNVLFNIIINMIIGVLIIYFTFTMNISKVYLFFMLLISFSVINFILYQFLIKKGERAILDLEV